MSHSNRNWQDFALLLVDVQQDFWTAELQQAFPDFESNLAQLLAFCRTEGLEVIHLHEVFQPDRSDWLPRYHLRQRAICLRGTAGARVLQVAQPQLGERVIEKQTQDGFHSPSLLPYLRSRQKQFILVAGLATAVCVLFTAASAAQLGFLATILSDCCADYPEAHAIALKRYRGFMLDIAEWHQLPQQWSGWQAQIDQIRVRSLGEYE